MSIHVVHEGKERPASLAAIEVSNGKPEAARKRLQDVTKARPKDFQAFLELAELSTRTGATPAETLELRRAAVNASPGEATPHLSLIGQLVAAGEMQQHPFAFIDAFHQVVECAS